jgi:hypothetical protein
VFASIGLLVAVAFVGYFLLIRRSRRGRDRRRRCRVFGMCRQRRDADVQPGVAPAAPAAGGGPSVGEQLDNDNEQIGRISLAADHIRRHAQRARPALLSGRSRVLSRRTITMTGDHAGDVDSKSIISSECMCVCVCVCVYHCSIHIYDRNCISLCPATNRHRPYAGGGQAFYAAAKVLTQEESEEEDFSILQEATDHHSQEW